MGYIFTLFLAPSTFFFFFLIHSSMTSVCVFDVFLLISIIMFQIRVWYLINSPLWCRCIPNSDDDDFCTRFVCVCVWTFTCMRETCKAILQGTIPRGCRQWTARGWTILITTAIHTLTQTHRHRHRRAIRCQTIRTIMPLTHRRQEMEAIPRTRRAIIRRSIHRPINVEPHRRFAAVTLAIRLIPTSHPLSRRRLVIRRISNTHQALPTAMAINDIQTIQDRIIPIRIAMVTTASIRKTIVAIQPRLMDHHQLLRLTLLAFCCCCSLDKRF